jgi:hypothetical protein
MKVPPPTTGGWVAFREFMLNFFENGVPADLTALNQHHDDLITKLTYAQLDTIAVLMNMQENFE